MWHLARPLIEAWMVQNRGIEARTREVAEQAIHHIEGLPQLVSNLEKAAAMLASGGVRLHPDSLAALSHGSRGPAWRPWLAACVLAAGAALVALLLRG
jgi:ubiquinone biosynthesis protein